MSRDVAGSFGPLLKCCQGCVSPCTASQRLWLQSDVCPRPRGVAQPGWGGWGQRSSPAAWPNSERHLSADLICSTWTCEPWYRDQKHYEATKWQQQQRPDDLLRTHMQHWYRGARMLRSSRAAFPKLRTRKNKFTFHVTTDITLHRSQEKLSKCISHTAETHTHPKWWGEDSSFSCSLERVFTCYLCVHLRRLQDDQHEGTSDRWDCSNCFDGVKKCNIDFTHSCLNSLLSSVDSWVTGDGGSHCHFLSTRTISPHVCLKLLTHPGPLQ